MQSIFSFLLKENKKTPSETKKFLKKMKFEILKDHIVHILFWYERNNYFECCGVHLVACSIIELPVCVSVMCFT